MYRIKQHDFEARLGLQYARFLVQYFITTKDEVFRCFKQFYEEYIMYVQSLPQKKDMGVITIISDGGKFNSNAIAEFYLDERLPPITICAIHGNIMG